MRRLLPQPVVEVDPMDLYPGLARPCPPGRPWLMINMIASADGAIAVGSTSEALGNPADQEVFSAVRACADWIVAAAGTVRVERYGLPRPGPAARRARAAAGRAAPAGLAVVSASLDLDPGLPLFADQRAGDRQPLVITGRSAPADAAARLKGVAEVVRTESQRPRPEEILAELAGRGASVVLCEGGPSFNAQFADAGLIDELCLSISPLVAGGPSSRVVHGSVRAKPQSMRLEHLIEASDTLFARYVDRGSPTSATA